MCCCPNNHLLPPSLSQFFKWKIARFEKVRSIDENVLGKDDSIIKSPSPHSLDGVKYMLTAAIEYIISIKRFDVPLSNVFIKTFFIHLSYLIFLYFLHLQMLSLDYFLTLFRFLDCLFLYFYIHLCISSNCKKSALSFAMTSNKFYLLIDSRAGFFLIDF